MAHAEGMELGCVCPECGRRCRDCLGTDTLISREEILAMKRQAQAAQAREGQGER